jgi:hypothetical protein
MILEIIQNKIFLIIIIAWAITQILKGILLGRKNKKWSIKYFYEPGHMPSSHSSFVSSLTTAIYLTEGISTAFIVSLAFSLIIIRDAFGARLQVGENAKRINKLMSTKKKSLREVTGHTLPEVIVGVIIGILVAIIVI